MSCTDALPWLVVGLQIAAGVVATAVLMRARATHRRARLMLDEARALRASPQRLCHGLYVLQGGRD